MTTKYRIEINKIKGKLNINIENNPWYVEILINIFFGIPIIIISSIFWVLGNCYYYIFIKPFEKPRTFESIKWEIIESNNAVKIEKSNAINNFLRSEEIEFLQEDQAYFIRTNPAINYFDKKIFTDFIAKFDDKVFLQRIYFVENKNEFQSEIISIDANNNIESIQQFDYYYLNYEILENTLLIKGCDQLGGKFEMKIINTAANSGNCCTTTLFFKQFTKSINYNLF